MNDDRSPASFAAPICWPRMVQGGVDYDLSALASLIRDWASESLLVSHSLRYIPDAENLNDLHPLIATNPRTARIKIALPDADELTHGVLPDVAAVSHRVAGVQPGKLDNFAHQLTGSTLGRSRDHAQDAKSMPAQRFWLTISCA